MNEFGWNPKERKQSVSATYNAEEIFQMAQRFREEGFKIQADKLDEIAHEFLSMAIFLDDYMNDRT